LRIIRKGELEEIINILHQPRPWRDTLATSRPRWRVLFALYSFGGENIQGFPLLALIVGVAIGTYSSFMFPRLLMDLSNCTREGSDPGGKRTTAQG